MRRVLTYQSDEAKASQQLICQKGEKELVEDLAIEILKDFET